MASVASVIGARRISRQVGVGLRWDLNQSIAPIESYRTSGGSSLATVSLIKKVHWHRFDATTGIVLMPLLLAKNTLSWWKFSFLRFLHKKQLYNVSWQFVPFLPIKELYSGQGFLRKSGSRRNYVMGSEKLRCPSEKLEWRTAEKWHWHQPPKGGDASSVYNGGLTMH